MRFKRSFSIALIASSVALVGLLALSLSTMDADSYSAGITGRTGTGCTCHSSSIAQNVQPLVEGLPSSYEPGRVYRLNLSFTGGPAAGTGPRAGFNLKVGDGTLLVPQGSGLVRVDPAKHEATHTTSGNKEDRWSILWRAPQEGSGDVEVVLVVNVVNGDGMPNSNDRWGRTSTTVEGSGGSFATYLLIAVLIVIAILVIWMVVGRSRSSSKPTAKRSTRKRGKRRRQ